MIELENWIDETQAQFYTFLAENCTEEEKSTFILSEKCMENVNNIIKSYDDNGFKKKRIQDGMEFVDARKPFENAKFGTLREKHNTYMNFILTLNSKQKEKRLIEKIEMEKIEEEKRQILQREEDERREELSRRESERMENERRERERIEAEMKHAAWRKRILEEDPNIDKIETPSLLPRDMNGIPMEIAEEKQNSFSDGRFIGAVYIKDSEDWDERFLRDKSSSWRVRL